MTELFIGGAVVLLGIVVAALVVYLGVWVFQRSTRELDEWAELRGGNVAVGIVLAAIVLAVALLLRPALSPPPLPADVGADVLPYYALAAQGLQLLIGLAATLAVIGFGLWLFAWLTRGLDEEAELQGGNQAVAALLAGVIVGVAWLLTPAVEQLMTAVVRAIFR